MPRKAKPARLWLAPARDDRQAMWVILDRGRQIGTGCVESDVAGAERALERYTGKKYDPSRWQGRGLDLPVAEVLTVYLREHAPTVKNTEFLIYTAEPVGRWWADKTLADVRKKTCEDYVTWRTGEGVSRATARHDLKTLRAAINYWHAAYGPLPAVPVVTLPETPAGRVRFLTRSEAARLLWAARRHSHVRRLILIGLYSGTRPGAILALRWLPSLVGGWVDLEAGVIYRRGDRELETAKARPTVRIHEKLRPFLARWRAEDLGIATVCHYQGGAVRKLRRSWASVVKAAGLGSDVTPHVLRHTCVTWTLQAGVPVWEVAGFVGMSEETVRKVYGHHSPDYQANAARASNKKR